MPPQITFKNEPPKEFSLAPNGDHALTVIEASVKMSKSSPNEYIELKCKEPVSGAHIFENLVFCESMQWKIEQFLKAIGHVPQVGDVVNFDRDFIKNVVIGSRFFAKVGVEEYESQGKKKTRNTVETIYTDRGVPGREPAPAPEPKITQDDVPMSFPAGKPHVPSANKPRW